MTDLVTLNENGKLFTTSLLVAEKFEKNHRDVLRALEALLPSLDKEFTERNFALSEYVDVTGRSLPCYNLSRDGFSLLAMGFTGQKALQWKVKFIEAFNKMEQELLDRKTIAPEDYPAALRALAESYEREQAAKKALSESQAQLKETTEVLAITTNELEIANDQLGYHRGHRSCIAMAEELDKYFNIKYKDFAGDYFYAQMGKFMTRLCNGQIVPGITFKVDKEYVPNARYNWINVYDIAAWDYFFGMISQGLISSSTKFIGKYWRG